MQYLNRTVLYTGYNYYQNFHQFISIFRLIKRDKVGKRNTGQDLIKSVISAKDTSKILKDIKVKIHS